MLTLAVGGSDPAVGGRGTTCKAAGMALALCLTPYVPRLSPLCSPVPGVTRASPPFGSHMAGCQASPGWPSMGL